MRVLMIFGTRPEAIKMAPVAHALAARAGVECRICVTAQHRDMLDQVLDVFGLRAHHDLDVMRPNQTLAELTSRLVARLDQVLELERPDAVLVQGDTTTAFVGALAAFYRRVPVGHVEAGLRTYDLQAPWPEELNRQLVSRVAHWQFAPTEHARQNLLREGVSDASIQVTGNTVIDALLTVSGRLDTEAGLVGPLAARFGMLDPQRRLILVTVHRRESFGEPLAEICQALARLAARPDVQIVLPVHPNPNVRQVVEASLGQTANVILCQPLDYLSFVYLMKRSHLIVTDSGGVQEEAPSLGKPVLVTRSVTERTEALEAGTVRLVGTGQEVILAEATRLLDDAAAREAMARISNPYGDGQAAARIAAVLAG